MKDLKFVSTDISVSFLGASFLWPFSKDKKLYVLYLQCYLKNNFNGEYYNFNHCQNLLKASNEIKIYVKIWLLNFFDNTEQNFPMGNAIKLHKWHFHNNFKANVCQGHLIELAIDMIAN